VPPKTWRPDPSWPPAPEDWAFWVDGKGNPVRGPLGQYGAPSRRVLYAGAAAAVLVLGVAVSAISLFGGSGETAAVKFLQDDASPTTPAVPPTSATTPTVTPPRVPKTVVPTQVPTPTVQPTRQPTQRPTQQPTQQPTQPTATRTTERTEPTPDPSPTRTTRSTKPPKSPKPTARPSTREELRQYCIDRGVDPDWCDPNTWQSQHP
jgi:outer membrane biosynthesis protein TonB